MMSEGFRVGRPPKFESNEELIQLINDYFDKCENAQEPLTISGLALSIGTTRKTLCDYEKKKEFSNTIKEAKAIVENFAEKRLYSTVCTGAIFALKNFGWSDKTVTEIEGGSLMPEKITVEVVDARKPDAEA